MRVHTCVCVRVRVRQLRYARRLPKPAFFTMTLRVSMCPQWYSRMAPLRSPALNFALPAALYSVAFSTALP